MCISFSMTVFPFHPQQVFGATSVGRKWRGSLAARSSLKPRRGRSFGGSVPMSPFASRFSQHGHRSGTVSPLQCSSPLLTSPLHPHSLSSYSICDAFSLCIISPRLVHFLHLLFRFFFLILILSWILVLGPLAPRRQILPLLSLRQTEASKVVQGPLGMVLVHTSIL